MTTQKTMASNMRSKNIGCKVSDTMRIYVHHDELWGAPGPEKGSFHDTRKSRFGNIIKSVFLIFRKDASARSGLVSMDSLAGSVTTTVNDYPIMTIDASNILPAKENPVSLVPRGSEVAEELPTWTVSLVSLLL